MHTHDTQVPWCKITVLSTAVFLHKTLGGFADEKLGIGSHYHLWTPRDHQVRRQCEAQGLNDKAIAERLGRTAATVKVQRYKFNHRQAAALDGDTFIKPPTREQLMAGR